MSLIYARKLDSLIYIIADTWSVTPARHEIHSAIQDPLVKILNISDTMSFAFYGDTYFLEKMALSTSPDHLVERLAEIAREASGHIDFVVIDRDAWKLLHITERGIFDKPAVLLGSNAATNRLQTERRRAPAPHGLALHIVRHPSDQRTEESTQFAKDVMAFSRAIETNCDDSGGIAVPYVMTRDTSSFATYATHIRAALSEQETAPSEHTEEWRTVRLQDSFNGGMTLCFGGGPDWFAYYLREPRFGFIRKYRSGTGPESWRMQNARQAEFLEIGAQKLGHPIEMPRFGDAEFTPLNPHPF